MLLTAIDSQPAVNGRDEICPSNEILKTVWSVTVLTHSLKVFNNVEKKAGDEDWRSHPCFGASEREQNITVWNVKISI